jgi:hypothetical protein
MLLWPSQPRDRLRAAGARATRALAELVDSELSGDPSTIARGDTANAAVREFRRSFVATPYRPTGPTGSTEALAFLVDELDWLLSFASPPRGRIEARWEPCREENREVMAAVVAVLRASAANLDGERRQPDLDGLDRARDAVAVTVVQRVVEATGTREEIDCRPRSSRRSGCGSCRLRRERSRSMRCALRLPWRRTSKGPPEHRIVARAGYDQRARHDPRFRRVQGLSSRTQADGRPRFETAFAEPRGWRLRY